LLFPGEDRVGARCCQRRANPFLDQVWPFRNEGAGCVLSVVVIVVDRGLLKAAMAEPRSPWQATGPRT
jgi:hypothetical protein